MVQTTQTADVSASARVRDAFEKLLTAYEAEPAPTYEVRMDRLERLGLMLKQRQDDIVDAVRADYGNRSAHETRIAEILMPLDQIRYLRKHLASWMKPRERHVSMTYKPARAKVHYQPKGVIGIISPWNYPVTLTVSPMAAAIAAGNRVLIKPSEHTPRTSQLLKELFAQTFEPGLVDVVTGGVDVGQAFSSLPFHHLLYTGSTAVGKLVMKAAAENLVPVTLELGGKSPTIIHESYPLEKAANRIAWGKCTNSGQTCIAPDYVLVPNGQVNALVKALERQVRDSYPSLADNPDYTCVIDERHHARLTKLRDDALAKGARAIEINPAAESFEGTTKIAPTLLLDVTDDMRVMQEEIFGPLLPIVSYERLDDAIDYVNARPRPLALYYFDDDRRRAQRVLERTVSGGAAINETLLHFGIDDMPFGGVGPSGMGAYHGKEGFETFSHAKAVLYQARLNATGLLSPPYGKLIDRMLGALIGPRWRV